ncbi:MAG TPA: EF-P lysine aminoacylase EpmA [Wenzhouxiangellaceae bacterium]|nr:EF-P lysine aminoacylase EpmA [Wenzhouxiangellaceae bacterium]
MLTAERLRARAGIIGRIRGFFVARGVLEVHTPVITDSGVTDLHIESLALADGRFLRTSPEYAHKRLLAAGSGDLFELGPVFRAAEHGRQHREEFTLLEWYRVDWEWRALATEVLELIGHVMPRHRWTREFVTWRELLLRETGIDLDTATETELRDAAPDAPRGLARPEILDWLFATRLQPALPSDRLTVVHDFPACQAALARLKPGQPQWAERFEIFAGALELANGYRELTDPAEQQRRFDRDNLRRSTMGRKTMPIDRALIEAMERGLPDCSGVALGVDRLMMVALAVDDIGRTQVF